MRKPFKYIALWSYYPDCPSCQGPEPCSSLEFYNKIKDLFEQVKEEFGQRELTSLYWIDGSELDTPDYRYSYHNVAEITWKYQGLKFRLVDTGKGKKIWLQENAVVKSLYDK